MLEQREEAPQAYAANSGQRPVGTDLYGALFQATRDGLLVVDDQGIYVDVNDAYAHLLGTTRDAAIGRHFSEFMPSDRLPEAEAAFEILKAGGPGLAEFPLRAIDGSLIDCEWTVHPHFLPGLSLCSARDIRARKHAQLALKNSEARFRFLAAVDDATRPLSDPEEIVRTVARLLGQYMDADSVAYCHFEPDQERFYVTGEYRRGAAKSLIGGYQLADFGGAVSQALQSNQTFVVDDVQADLALSAYRDLEIRAHVMVPLHKAGHLVAAMGVQQLTPRTWRADEIELLQIVANRSWESIQRAGVEARMRRQTYSFDALLSNLPDLICTFDLEGRFTYANPALLTVWQRSLEEIIGKNTFDLGYPPALAERIQAEVRVVIDTHHPVRNQTPFAGPGGETRLYEYIFSPAGGVDGRLEGVTCTARDLTDRKRAEEALAESERRFRAFVTTSSDVVYRMSPDWREMRHLEGKDFVPNTENSTSDWLAKYIHPEDRTFVKAAIDNAIANKSPFELEHRVIRVDGSLGWTFSRAVPLLNSDGDIVEWFGAARDVTERRRTEAAVTQLTAESEQQRRLYNTILSNTPDLVYVFDLQHCFTYANNALLEMWGKTWEEASGKNCLELGYEPWHAAMHDREIEQVIATREPIRGQVPFSGTRGRRIYDYIFVPVIGANGEVEAVAGTTRDVTDQNKAEERLREAADRFRFMAESMPQKIFTANSAGEVDYFNLQWVEFTGLPFEEISGAEWTQVIHPEDREETVRRWHRSVETGEPFVSTHRLRRGDGAYLWHLSRSHAMRDRDGKITMWIGSATDIQEQKATEEELRRANHDLEQFAYSASHDLQEPLRSIKIYGELLAQQYRDRLQGDALAYLDFLLAGATRMEMLVRDLLSYAQVSLTEQAAEFVDAGECLGTALANLSGAISESGGTIQAGPLPSVRAHATHVQQLFQNLIGNAIKYRRAGVPPVVKISGGRQNENWLFSVQDNGIGIEEQYHDRIFGLFKRLHTSNEYSGTGIGLALCSRILEHYHCRIWVESEPGAGSTFYFTLPV